MPEIPLARSCQVSSLLKTWYTPKPTMPIASSATNVLSMIGGRLPPPLPPVFAGVAAFVADRPAAPADFAAAADFVDAVDFAAAADFAADRPVPVLPVVFPADPAPVLPSDASLEVSVWPSADLGEGVDLRAGLAPAAGRDDGRRLPPVCGLLMLIGPRRDRLGRGARGSGATSRIVTGTSGRHQDPKCTPASIGR